MGELYYHRRSAYTLNLILFFIHLEEECFLLNGEALKSVPRPLVKWHYIVEPPPC